MINKIKNLKGLTLILVVCLSFYSCEDKILDLTDLNQGTSDTFFQNEVELELAINATYRFHYGLDTESGPLHMILDNCTDLGFFRGTGVGLGAVPISSHTSETGVFRNIYSQMYSGVSRANNVLDNLDNAKDQIDPERFEQIRGEALFLRAYAYYWLTEYFGDVPYVTTVPTDPIAAIVPRTAKSTIVDGLLSDLDIAIAALPDTWPPLDNGRATKGSARLLAARIALNNERYGIAEQKSLDVMNSGTYSLYPDYHDLFQPEGDSSSEVIFDLSYQEGFRTTNVIRRYAGRFVGWSQNVPSQELVDSYECTDGLPIDESPLYDPANPFDNRDPRLDGSIVVSGTRWGDYIFSTNPSDGQVLSFASDPAGVLVTNQNVTNAFASFTGYLWKKFVSEEELIARKVSNAEHDVIMMRYAEVLLTYAEAKIEQGSIDQTVLDALNDIRARAYGTTRGDTANYPEVITTSQTELRKILRRERKVELASEGFRLFDIRRWRIAEKVMDGTFYARPDMDYSDMTFTPSIDDDGHVSYAGGESFYRVTRDNGDRVFDASRDYLFPIPQAEINVNNGVVTQNPGY